MPRGWYRPRFSSFTLAVAVTVAVVVKISLTVTVEQASAAPDETPIKAPPIGGLLPTVTVIAAPPVLEDDAEGDGDGDGDGAGTAAAAEDDEADADELGASTTGSAATPDGRGVTWSTLRLMG